MDEIRMTGTDMNAAMQEWVDAHMKDRHTVTSVSWNSPMCQFVVKVEASTAPEPRTN